MGKRLIAGFLMVAALAHGAAALEGMTGLAAWQTDPSVILEGSEVELEAFRWHARPLIVFADSDRDPAFIRQLELIRQDRDALVARDVVVIVDTDTSEPSELRTSLRPRGFMLTLIGKDGGVKLQKPLPWSVREISRSIDKIPLRQQEMREQRLRTN